MFTATIGGYNVRTQPVFQHQPRMWRRESEPEPEPQATAQGHGRRKAGETSLTGKPKDPTWELEKEILGK